MGLYRLHQGSCMPRYDQAANGMYDAQRQETLLLKQRFLENKAKKTKRHAPARDNSNSDAKNAQIVAQAKMKRTSASPLLDCNIDGMNDNHQSKMRNATPEHHNSSASQSGGMPSFSVQIVQQFTSTNTSQAPHSQTIQTNVTVQAVSGAAIQTSNSPMATTTVSPINTGNVGLHPNPGNVNTASSTSISVGTSIECKQEPDGNFAPCSMANARSMNNISNSTNDVGGTTHTTGINIGDRFSDSLANLGFPEDSSDDVIHPDILKDIIDDVFTNPSDLMNGFSFVDNLKDSNGITNICQNIVEEKHSPSLSNGKGPFSTSHPQAQFQNPNNPAVSQFSVSQTQQAVFDFQAGGSTNSTLTRNGVTASQTFGQSRMSPYPATSQNMPSINSNNTALGLDFKLSEPSPAAQTLKQMAEQHQNMKQKQLGMGITNASHPRSPYGSDNFSDPLSSIRSNFLNGSSGVNQLQKSPNNLLQSMSYSQQQNFSTTAPAPVKQEVHSPVPPIYNTMPTPSAAVSDMDMLNRRQPPPQFSQSTEPLGMASNSPYPCSRPLSHYGDPLSLGITSHSSASNSPVPVQFLRGSATRGVTPPPKNFSPSPSAGSTLHLSQNQQLQISQNNQQLQVSQSQQQLIMSQDVKPTLNSQSQQQMQARNFYSGHPTTSVQMSQSQSMSFQFGSSAGSHNSPNNGQRPQQGNTTMAARNSEQRHMQPFVGRQTPEYQLQSMENKNLKHQMKSVVDNQVTNQRGRKVVANYTPMDQSSQSMMLPVNNAGRGRAQRAVAPAKSTHPRQQRPPNVNVGPEGLNISQRPPMATDWRHVYMQQQINSPLPIKIPVSRTDLVPNPLTQHYAQPQLDPNSRSNMNCLPPSHNVICNPMASQLDTSSLNIGGMTDSGHLQIMMQQHQTGLKNSVNLEPSRQLPTSLHELRQHPFSPKGAPKLDDPPPGLSSEGNQYLLDFLDNIDYSTSDLLNFDVMHGGSSFPLLDDMGMLGK